MDDCEKVWIKIEDGKQRMPICIRVPLTDDVQDIIEYILKKEKVGTSTSLVHPYKYNTNRAIETNVTVTELVKDCGTYDNPLVLCIPEALGMSPGMSPIKYHTMYLPRVT